MIALMVFAAQNRLQRQRTINSRSVKGNKGPDEDDAVDDDENEEEEEEELLPPLNPPILIAAEDTLNKRSLSEHIFIAWSLGGVCVHLNKVCSSIPTAHIKSAYGNL